jgi:D-glycero-D-manno-heptose 1,7-bisphosphate phosphatase
VIIYLKNSSHLLIEQLKLLFKNIVVSQDENDLLGGEVLFFENLKYLPFNPSHLINAVKKNTVNEGRSLKIVENKSQKLLLIKKDFSIDQEGVLPPEFLDGYEYSGMRYFQDYITLNESSDYSCFPMGHSTSEFNYKDSKPALFLDRDGILNEDHGYVYKYDDIEWKQESIDLIKWANSKDYLVFVLTNQSGISKGLYTEDDVIKTHKSMNEFLLKQGALITSWYYGPYSYQNAIEGYKFKSLTRKPGAGMMLQALSDYNIDLLSSVMVGDKTSDGLILLGPKYFHLEGKYDLEDAPGLIIKSLSELHNFIK